MKRISVKELTAEEKLRLLCGDGFWNLYNAEGKLPKITVSDGPVGLRRVLSVREDGSDVMKPSVAYPTIAVLANTWDRTLAREMGASLADDCLENGVDILLAPGVNIKRDPRNGRNFEYFSEDPYLAGDMAREYIEGLQENGVGACLKHFCANNLEYNRFEQSSEVDTRTLREIYYEAFRIACKAEPVSIMCSYNRINGRYASENKKGFSVLRTDFGFKGAIFSDWEAVRDRTCSAKAGLDIEMPFNREHYERLLKDYQNGILTEEELDACAQRVIELIYRCKEMSCGKKPRRSVSERLELAADIEREGAVLLKNEGILPLRKGAKVAVNGCYGKPATPSLVFGGGSARMVWLEQPFDIASLLGSRLGTEVLYERAFLPKEVSGNGTLGIPGKAVENAALADVNIVCAGTGADIEYESGDREILRLPEVQERAIIDEAKVNPNTVVILFTGSVVDVTAWEPYVKAILWAGFCGERGGEAIADILCGLVNPSGRLTETFPYSLSDIPAVQSYRNGNVTLYSEGLNVGYRYFDTFQIPVRYPFGYGLSYSLFKYENISLALEENALCISYWIHNVSDEGGKEVSQVYVHPIAAKVYRPNKELKGWSKDFIESGKKICVKVRLDFAAFAYWSEAEDRMTIDDGLYEIIVGSNCENSHLSAKVVVENGIFKII